MPKQYSRKRMRSYLRERRAERKARLIEQLGGACRVCGSTERLEFDHKDPRTKKSLISLLLAHSEARIQQEVSKCQLLCKPCHAKKTTRENQKKVCHKGHPFKGTNLRMRGNNRVCKTCAREYMRVYRSRLVGQLGLEPS